MSLGFITNQGRFTSNGSSRNIEIRSNVDWMVVRNFTKFGVNGAVGPIGLEFHWDRGMAAGAALIKYYLNGGNTLAGARMTFGGFTLIDSSVNELLNPVALAAGGINGATPPVVATADTSGLAVGDVVQISNQVGAAQLGGIDFEIAAIIPNTSFTLRYMRAIAAAAGATGFYRKRPFPPLYYPRRRFASRISNAAQAIVTMTVTHQFTAGQKVRFIVPAAYGMTQMNNLIGTIIRIGDADADGYTNTITVDIDTTGFTNFAFPLTAAAPFSPALVVPVGEAASDPFINLLDDATINRGFIGMNLGIGGTNAALPGPIDMVGPAGTNNDVMYWEAGTSFLVDNQ